MLCVGWREKRHNRKGDYEKTEFWVCVCVLMLFSNVISIFVRAGGRLWRHDNDDDELMFDYVFG